MLGQGRINQSCEIYFDIKNGRAQMWLHPKAWTPNKVLTFSVLCRRFLNTIIDDLFAFVIKMPTLHRHALLSFQIRTRLPEEIASFWYWSMRQLIPCISWNFVTKMAKATFWNRVRNGAAAWEGLQCLAFSKSPSCQRNLLEGH